MTIVELVTQLFGVLVIGITLLPMWRSTRWWVRVCDFPRIQVAVLAVATIGVLLVTQRSLEFFNIVLVGAVGLSAAWQVSWVWRYLPGSPREVAAIIEADGSNCIKLLTSNVHQQTRDAEALLEIIFEANPDVILAVETDEWWCSRLTDALSAGYPHRLVYPLSTGYGLVLISRLELRDPSVRFLIDEAIPSVKTGIRLREGSIIDLYGMHPPPPAPNQDSTERDVELIKVGIEIRRGQRPAIVLGDLNDVAWSPTTSKFKRVGGLLDPRQGRGFFNTFPAGMPGLRYPLDYVFHTPHFAVRDMRVLPRFKSDHLPLAVTLCLRND